MRARYIGECLSLSSTLALYMQTGGGGGGVRVITWERKSGREERRVLIGGGTDRGREGDSKYSRRWGGDESSRIRIAAAADIYALLYDVGTDAMIAGQKSTKKGECRKEGISCHSFFPPGIFHSRLCKSFLCLCLFIKSLFLKKTWSIGFVIVRRI